ncbi:hypothetical protein MRB53_037321 [Persea americana]|nr:hypothetical protein MRB53_037321 [Persea americana]
MATIHSRSSSGEVPTMKSLENAPSDLDLLHKWHNLERVARFWGEGGLARIRSNSSRTPWAASTVSQLIGCWNGKPFGYFEIYWVKEDILGKYLGGNVDAFDRGIHCLVGETEFRGPHRVPIWLSALVHYCWLADMRTATVMMEPRVGQCQAGQLCSRRWILQGARDSIPT